DYIPSLYLAERLHAASIQTYDGVAQHVLERDPVKMQQLLLYIQQKSIERMDLLAQHEALLRTPGERALAEVTKVALAQYMVERAEVLRLSADPRTKPEAVMMLRDRLEPLYAKMQEAIEAEGELSRFGADAASKRIETTVTSTQEAILVSLLIGVILALASGYVLI